MFDFVTHHKTPLELLLSVLRKWKNSTISPQFRTAFWKLGLQTAGMWINSGTIDKKKKLDDEEINPNILRSTESHKTN